jgi:hypothetical protein
MVILYFLTYVILHLLAGRIDPNVIPYPTYIVDLVFVLISLKFFKTNFNPTQTPRLSKPQWIALYFSFLVAGSLANLGSIWIGFVHPFGELNFRLIFLLLVVAPILEESLYRVGFWNVLSRIPVLASKDRSASVALTVMTALLFSLAHFEAIFVVPAEFKVFVVYQSLYTFTLGLVLGEMRRRLTFGTGWCAVIFAHFLFNLGFGLIELF